MPYGREYNDIMSMIPEEILDCFQHVVFPHYSSAMLRQYMRLSTFAFDAPQNRKIDFRNHRWATVKLTPPTMLIDFYDGNGAHFQMCPLSTILDNVQKDLINVWFQYKFRINDDGIGALHHIIKMFSHMLRTQYDYDYTRLSGLIAVCDNQNLVNDIIDICDKTDNHELTMIVMRIADETGFGNTNFRL